MHENFSLLGFNAIDTLVRFVRYDIQGDTCSYHHTTSSSSFYTTADTIISFTPFEYFKVRRLSIGDTINEELPFINDPNKDYILRHYETSHVNFLQCFQEEIHFGNWPRITSDRYTAFKLEKENSIFLGWIKFDLHFDYSADMVKIKEIAYAEILDEVVNHLGNLLNLYPNNINNGKYSYW